jgi:hypothetical protein
VRTVGWLVAILLAVGWLVSELPAVSSGQPDGQRTPWRRTRDGWRYAYWLGTPGAVEPAQFHPGLLALFEVSFSVWALRALPGKPGARRQTWVEGRVPAPAMKIREGKPDAPAIVTRPVEMGGRR